MSPPVVPRRPVAAIIVAVGVGLGAASLMTRHDEGPEQPIPFSHRDHVRGDGLACELCHSGVRRSPFAGMPPVARCMGCHRFVLPDNPGVTTLRRFADAGQPIPWVKVYVLPRFVHFTHEAHVLAGVRCETCHGDVGAMTRIARVAPLTMGWCLGCHRDTRAPDDCLTCHY